MLTSIKDAVFYHIYPLGFCGAINNGKDISTNSSIPCDEWDIGFDYYK